MYLERIRQLRATRAKVRFLSLEPLLGPLPRLPLSGIHWVIVGGESGPGCRPMDLAWVTDIRDQCLRAEVPFFFKQWGGTNKKMTGRLLDSRTWDEMPLAIAGRPRWSIFIERSETPRRSFRYPSQSDAEVWAKDYALDERGLSSRDRPRVDTGDANRADGPP